MKLKYNGLEFCIIEELEMSESIRELEYSDIKISFEGYTIDDLPVKYQEVQIWNDTEILFFGYVSNIKLPTFDRQNKSKMLEIELLTPYAMAISRVVSIVGEYRLNESMNIIFDKLIGDGFIIVENDLKDTLISLKFIAKTVELVVNRLANKYKFFWYIDEKKGIHIKYIDNITTTVLDINDSNCPSYLSSLSPKIRAVDYANTLFIKNARLYYYSFAFHDDPNSNVFPIMQVPQNITDGLEVKLINPFDISESASKRILYHKQQFTTTVLRIDDILGDGVANIFYVNDVGFEFSDNIGFTNQDEDNANKTILLVRDSFFSTLIVGIKFKTAFRIGAISSETALKRTTLRFLDIKEIERNKGKISSSGAIEKTIDVNQRWFVLEELVEFAKTQITLNSSQTDEVEILFKSDIEDIPSIKLGNILALNFPNSFVQGNFIVTNITKLFSATKVDEVVLSCRNSNLIENFADFFRADEEEESEEQLTTEIIINQIEEEIFEEKVYIANNEVITSEN